MNLQATSILLSENQQLDDFQIEMTKRNQIPGLLPFIIEDGVLHYDIGDLLSLENYLKSRTLTIKGFRALLENFIGIIEDCVLYYLDKKNYVVSSQYIYVNHDLTVMKIAYLPLLEDEMNEAAESCPLRHFIYQVLLPKVKLNLEEDWTFLLSGLSQLNSFDEGSLPFDRIESLFVMGGKTEKVAKEVSYQYEDKIQEHVPSKPSLKSKIFSVVKKNVPNIQKSETKEPISGKTTVLRTENVCGKLRATDKRYGDIVLNKEAIIIGRHKKTADVLLNDSSIGKLHAEIICEKEDYYLRDLNSVNGTFINDERLMPYEMKAISTGDLIKFATVIYEVDYGL